MQKCVTMGSKLSIDYFISELERTNGNLGEAREKLGIAPGRELKFDHVGLGK